MALDLTDPKVTNFTGASMEDVAKGVHDMVEMVREDKAQIDQGLKSKQESLDVLERRLNEIGQQMDSLRKQWPVDGPVHPMHGEYATRPGGLFRRGKAALPAQELLSLSPTSSILRGSDAELVKDFQDTWDAMMFKYLLETCARGLDNRQVAMEKTLRGPDFERMERLAEHAGYQKTLIHPASGGIANPLTWSLLSAQILDLVKLDLRVVSQMVQVPLSHTDQEIPCNRGDAIGVRGGAETTDPPPRATISSLIPDSSMFGTIAFGKATFKVEDVMSYLWWSDRAVQESVISLVPYLRNMIAYAISRALEHATVSGDEQGRVAGAHMDDWQNNFTTRDARMLWNGLRRLAANNSMSTGGNALDSSDIAAGHKAMGVYGYDVTQLRLFCTLGTYSDLLVDSKVRTADLFGVDRATIRTGALASVHGIEIIPTPWIPEDLDANGFSANGGVLTEALLCNISRFMFGTIGALGVEATRWAPMLTTIMQAQLQADFVPMEPLSGGVFASGVTPVYRLRNITK